MNVDLSALADFNGTTRLFPLPNVVFFPHVLLPLHIFEQRYRDMTRDALATDRLITMALPKPGWEQSYDGRPDLFPMACLGRVIRDQRLEDGRYHLVLRGVTRVRILEELPADSLYRVARVEVVQDEAILNLQHATKLTEELRQSVLDWAARHDSPPDPLRALFENQLSLGVLSDILGFAVSFSADTKQRLLEEIDVLERTRLLIDALHRMTGNKPSPGRFPPKFSVN
jgi:Lon protease-like protein